MRDYYRAYDGERNSPLYEPMRDVVAEMGKAMWSFAQIKEMTWYGWGYAGITAAIHYLEHTMPEYIDQFKGLMAQLGLPIAYPPIPELKAQYGDLKQVFDACMEIIDSVNEALSRFIEVADTSRFEPLARKAENIQMLNYEPRAWLTHARAMAENDVSASSIDSWLAHTLEAPQKE